MVPPKQKKLLNSNNKVRCAMNISYNTLGNYLPEVKKHTAEEIAEMLTSTGLEVASVTKVEPIPGGLKGLVVGKVLTCEAHPNSDHLHITTVEVGQTAPLQIVCGAPNVAMGQKVIVATIGTTLYDGEQSFTIKKSKLRGTDSYGMICSEKEVGIGTDASGIMVLPSDASIGTPAADYFNLASDYCIEVDITPNRVDATSHYGVARDLAAYFSARGNEMRAVLPRVDNLANRYPDNGIGVILNVDANDCPRYSGITLEGIHNTESPKWLKELFATIGLKSINLIVDLSNFVLHETGQPIHVFDADKLEGDLLKVQKLPEGTLFTTLDGVEHKLNGREIMVTTQSDKPLCMAGIFGGKTAEVTLATTRVFIESANFNSSIIRKAARYHGLSTDSSFRFERGLDPQATEYALARMVQLTMEYCPSAKLVGDKVDIIAKPFDEPRCTLSLTRMNNVLGGIIPAETVKRILMALDIVVEKDEGETLSLLLPRYRTDVRREADVYEEVLRIYGYNEFPLTGYITANLSAKSKTDKLYRTELLLSEQLVGAGYSEILNNSLSSEKYYTELTSLRKERLVRILNPLSGELAVMRQTLLFGGLEAVGRNSRNKQPFSYFFEWGNAYRTSPKEKEAKPAFNAGQARLDGYEEVPLLALWNAGTLAEDSWTATKRPASFFRLKADVENIFRRISLAPETLLQNTLAESDLFVDELNYTTPSGKVIARLGEVAPSILEKLDIRIPVFFAELRFDLMMAEVENNKLQVGEINKFPTVVRDFALLIDENITFAELEKCAKHAGGKLLREVRLFDVYKGRNLPQGKVSYALRFRLQEDKGTLTEKQIEKIMNNIRTRLEKELGATIR